MRKESYVINFHVHIPSHINTHLHGKRKKDGKRSERQWKLSIENELPQSTVKMIQSFLHCCIGQPR